MRCAIDDCGEQARNVLSRGREELDVCAEHAVVLMFDGATVRDEPEMWR